VSTAVFDVSIWILLILGTGFGMLSFFGLLIFPDIRSRRFTVTRALLLSTTLLMSAVLVFSLYKYPGGEAEYTGLAIRALLIWVLLTATSLFVSRHILRQVAEIENAAAKNG